MHFPTFVLAFSILWGSLAQTVLSLPSSAVREQFELTALTVDEGLTTPKNIECGRDYDIWIRHAGTTGSGHTTAACTKMVDFFSGLTSNHNAVNFWIVCPSNAPLANKGTRPTEMGFSYTPGQWIDFQSKDKEQRPSGVLRIEKKGERVLEVDVKLGVAVKDKGDKKDALIEYIYCT